MRIIHVTVELIGLWGPSVLPGVQVAQDGFQPQPSTPQTEKPVVLSHSVHDEAGREAYEARQDWTD